MDSHVDTRLNDSAEAVRPRSPAEDGRACDLCDSQEFKLLHEWPAGDRWNPATIPLSVWKCRCELVLLHPVPRPDQLPAGGEWWSGDRKRPVRNKRFKKIRTRVQHFIFGTPRERLLQATRRAMPHGRLLDVGCGQGGLLNLAARTYDCVGLEPSPVAAARARRRGFPVIESTLQDADIQPASFDVVLMDSVIEHVDSPVQVLRKVNHILHDRGIVVLKTPKFGGPAYKRHGAYWSGFRHGYHTYLFNGQTLSNTLNAAGFEVMRRPSRNRMLDDILILWGRKVREAEPLETQRSIAA